MEVCYFDEYSHHMTKDVITDRRPSSKKRKEKQLPSKLVINVAKAKILTAKTSAQIIGNNEVKISNHASVSPTVGEILKQDLIPLKVDQTTAKRTTVYDRAKYNLFGG